MFSRAAAISWQSRAGLSAIVAALIGAYCFATAHRDQGSGSGGGEASDQSAARWWSAFRIFVLSAVAIFIVSGLFLGKGARGGDKAKVGGDARIPAACPPAPADPNQMLMQALQCIDTNPASF